MVRRRRGGKDRQVGSWKQKRVTAAEVRRILQLGPEGRHKGRVGSEEPEKQPEQERRSLSVNLRRARNLKQKKCNFLKIKT